MLIRVAQFFLFLAVSTFFLSCDKRSNDLWEEEKTQIRNYLQSQGVSDYVEDSDAGYFYYFTNTDSIRNGRPNVGSIVELYYSAGLLDGTVYYSTDPGYPDQVKLTDAIVGWQLALPKFNIGTMGKIILPSRLAYGTKGLSDEYGNELVPPNSILIFEIEMVEIHPHF